MTRCGRRSFLLGAAGAVALGTATACATSDATTLPSAVPALRPGATDTEWTRMPAGPVPRADGMGRLYLQSRVPDSVPPVTVGGAPGPGLHGNLPDGRSASYVVQDLRRPVSEIGAVFAFGPGSTMGSLCLARFDRWADGFRSSGDVRTSLHLGITSERWTYGIARSPKLEVVKTKRFAIPIPHDGSPHTMRVAVQGSTATIVEPDGTVATVDDPRLAVAPTETFACWEFFKLGAGASNVTFLRTWAQ